MEILTAPFQNRLLDLMKPRLEIGHRISYITYVNLHNIVYLLKKHR